MEAYRIGAYRDRSVVYDDYYVADFAKLDSDMRENHREWSFDCLTCIASLGFGDQRREQERQQRPAEERTIHHAIRRETDEEAEHEIDD